MKRLNYYQVHKNKNPKLFLYKRHKYVKYMLVMAKRSFKLQKSFESLTCSMDEFLESIKTPAYAKNEEIRGVSPIELITDKLLILDEIDYSVDVNRMNLVIKRTSKFSIDSGGGTT